MEPPEIITELPVQDCEYLDVSEASLSDYRENIIQDDVQDDVRDDVQDDVRDDVRDDVQNDIVRKTDVIVCRHNKDKNTECTICTESISDSGSEEESENFKCTTCSNYVHPLCLYNYGIYHEVKDLNSISCYVCEKGVLRPNNSTGRRLQMIADGIRRTPYIDSGLSEGLLDYESDQDIESGNQGRREIINNIPNSPLRREMIQRQLGFVHEYETYRTDEGRLETSLSDQQCLKYCRIILFYFLVLGFIMSFIVIISYNIYLK